MDAVRVADPQQVRPELVVDAGVLTLCEQVDVVFGDHPAVAIRVVNLDGVSARVGDPEAIVEDLLRVREDCLEYTRRVACHRRRAPIASDVDTLR